MPTPTPETSAENPYPPLDSRIAAAMFVIALGAEKCGARTLRFLMHPYTNFTAEDASRTAARLISSVHIATLTILPPHASQQILKDLSAYLSFAHGDGWPDEKSQSPANESHPRERQETEIQTTLDCHHHDRQENKDGIDTQLTSDSAMTSSQSITGA